MYTWTTAYRLHAMHITAVINYGSYATAYGSTNTTQVVCHVHMALLIHHRMFAMYIWLP